MATYYAFHKYAYYFRLVNFIDTMTLILIVVNIMTMLRNFLWIDFFFGALTDSLRAAVFFVIIFTSTVVGMAVCSITLYGT